MRAVHLQTEYLTEPLGLGISTPHFFWHCQDGIAQSAYQIIAKVDDETVWNSGKVESATMTHIAYEGRKLHSRERVCWSVKLWDENGKEGEISSSWFELGLLEAPDWTAKWIAGNYKPKKNVRYPVDCFRKIISAEKEIQSARLYASAKGLYDVTINGKRIEDFIMAPGMTDYRKRIQYQTYDITNMLVGENTVELRLADGWFRGSSAAYGAVNVYGIQTGVIAQLEIIYRDGTKKIIGTDATWAWSNDGQVRFADLKDGEVYNASMVPSYFGNAVEINNAVALVASNNVLVREHECFSPVLLPGNILDFGQNLAGYLNFSVQGKPGQMMILTCGEILDENGNLDMSNIQEQRPAKGWSQPKLITKLLTGKTVGNAVVNTPMQQIRFICSGGLDHYKTSFAVFGFRYVHVDSDFPINPEEFTAVAVYSDMEEVGDFKCSEPLVNKLVENTRWSMKSNFLDLPTDCPTRERLGWTGDAQIFFDTGSYLMDTSAFFRKWLKDMDDAQYKNGLLPAVLPYQGVEMMYKATGSSVGWADAIYLIPYRYWKRFGDRDILIQYWPMIKRYADYLLKNLGMRDKKEAQANPYNAYTYEKGVHLGEWLEPEEFRDKVYGAQAKHPEECTAYFYLAMTTMAEIAEVLDKEEYAEEFKKYADGAKKAYIQFAELTTNRQAKMVRPLAFGLLDDEIKQSAQIQLKKAVEEYHFRVGTGFLSTPFILQVLTEAGELETAYKMLLNNKKPGWLAEILEGATTIWENWEGNLSQNHYSPGAVCQWLFDTVGGIRVAGENHFVIAPKPGGELSYASTDYQSLYGKVVCSWQRENGVTVYSISIPANTSAEVILPSGDCKILGAGNYRMEEAWETK